MTHYDDTRDVFAQIHKLEVQSGFRGYNHFAAAPSTWRQERDCAKCKAASQRDMHPSSRSRFLQRIFVILNFAGVVKPAQS